MKARYEKVPTVQVQVQERVLLDLSLSEFLSLYGLHYIGGSGNPQPSDLRYKVERGLHEAMTVLEHSAGPRVGAFMKAFKAGKGTAYDRIDRALERAGIER